MANLIRFSGDGIELTGTAAAGDVYTGKTFYSTNPDNKITGTLALSGNAAASDVRTGKTFYSTSPYSKQTGNATHIMENAVGVSCLYEWSYEKNDGSWSYTATSNGILLAFMYAFSTGGWGISVGGSGRKDFVNRTKDGTSWTGCKTLIRKMQRGDTFSCTIGSGGDGRYGQGAQFFWIPGF